MKGGGDTKRIGSKFNAASPPFISERAARAKRGAAAAAAEDANRTAAAMSLTTSQNLHTPPPTPLSAKAFLGEATRLGAQYSFSGAGQFSRVGDGNGARGIGV